MPAKFEDVVKMFEDTQSEFGLTKIPFQVGKEGIADALARMQASEAAIADLEKRVAALEKPGA